MTSNTQPTPTPADEELADAIVNAFAPVVALENRAWLAKIIAAHRAPMEAQSHAHEPTRDEMLNMVAAMHSYGGGFVKALAECFIIADSDNTTRLYRAFPEYVKQYTEMAKIDAERKAVTE